MSFASQFVPGSQWLAIGALICSALLVRLLVATMTPARRPFAWMVASFVLGLAALTFQLIVLNALGSGEVDCLWKGCDRTYTWSQTRPLFWGNVVVLQGLTCVAWAMTAYAIGSIFGIWRSRPNKTREPTR